MRTITLALVLITLPVPVTALRPARAAEAERVDYLRDVKPILRAKCYACHGALKEEGGLRLDTAGLARDGGYSGPAVEPGDAAASPLLDRVTSDDKDLRMPQEGEPLSDQQVATLRRWIEQGAEAPPDEQPEADPRRHWAFLRPERPPLPVLQHSASWARNPIDAFVAAKHEQLGLRPLSEAEKPVLLRRLYLDLIGLPPTREQLQAFLNDPSPQAYERVVDSLLASPQYGERWGRHWMDVWRYSDWYGRRGVPDVLNSYGQIWRWRDWIVRSLNEDKGYDRMVVEMLAADEVAGADERNVVATGFIVRNFYRWNYNTWLKDTVEHTGKAFLGITLNCCHCHDHKYDPITNEEYFRFRAFFEPIEIRHGRVPGEPDPGVYPKYSYGKSYKPITSGLVRIMDEKLDAETYMYSGGESRNILPGKPPVSPGGPAVLGGDQLRIEPVDLPPEAWYPGLKPFVRQEARNEVQSDLAAAQATLQKARQLVADASDTAGREDAERTLRVDEANMQRARQRLAAVEARILADKIRYQGHPGDPDQAAREAARAERQVTVAEARVELARAERELARLQEQQPQAEQAQAEPAQDEKAEAELQKARQRLAAAGSQLQQAEAALQQDSTDYTPFGPKYPPQSTGRRTALARWIASEDNPLTARVAVNHMWLRHFGRALVPSTENFGRNGDSPSHPALLDWLAVELMQNGWRMKHLHRLIVTSSAYRMQSATRGTEHPNYALDRDNRFLWRFQPSRMEAEVVRDSILHAAGQLDLTLGGKEIEQQQGLTNPRRSLYFAHHGEGRMPLLELFDASDPCDCYRRSTSVRPQQALALTNSELALRQSRRLARLLAPLADGREDPRREFIQIAFLQILGRSPSPEELSASGEFLREQIELFESVDPDTLAATAHDQALPASTDAVQRARENLVHALFSHHEFVTIR